MSDPSHPPRQTAASSVLLVSPDTEYAKGLADGLSENGDRRVETRLSEPGAMNGQARELLSGHDVVMLDLRRGFATDFEAVSGAVAAAPEEAHLLALAAHDLSIVEAQKLIQVGFREVIPGTIEPDALGKILDRHRAGRDRATGGSATSKGDVIAVTKARGGVGATTVAVNLACKLRGGGGLLRNRPVRRVALLDLDLQFGNVNAFLDLEDNGALLELLQSGHSPDASYLRGMMQSHGNGLDLLSSPTPLVPLTAMTAAMAGTLLDGLRSEYDVLVVDLPQVLVDWIGAVFERSNRIVMVTDTTVPSIRQARRLSEFFGEEHAGVPVEFVVNRETRPVMKTATVREAENALDASLDHWLPEAAADARKAADLGQPVVDLVPNSRLARAFAKLADALAPQTSPATRSPH